MAVAVAPGPNRVTTENRRPGDTRWRLPWAGYTLADDAAKQVKGYASATSVNVGGTIDLKVSVSAPGSVAYHVFRLGWYGGLGGRLMTSGSAAVTTQPACPMTTSTGLRSCAWSTMRTLAVGTDWTSGLYVATLTRGTYQNYIVFTVRDDARTADAVEVQATNTYQAYNNFPSDRATGKSLYTYNSYGAATSGGSAAAVKVSYNRPYATHGAGLLFEFEAPTARYLEQRGVDVKYATNVDLHRTPGRLHARAVLFAGHDEYWSAEMFTNVESARGAGAALTFLTANNVYWQARFEDSDRTLVCWREWMRDPEPTTALKTLRFRETGRPEQPLLGLMWPTNGLGAPAVDAPWVVANASHWIYRGTRLVAGSRLPNLVGGEVDRRMPAVAGPESTRWEILAQSPYATSNGISDIHESTVYLSAAGSWVFSAGTLRFARALGGETGQNALAQTMATNILARQVPGPDRTAGADVPALRLSGFDRYQTAVAVSRQHFPDGFGGVVHIATGLNFPDAVSAAAASRGAGPVLMVPGSWVPQAVLDELARLHPNRVVVVGSAAVVSDAALLSVGKAAGVTPVRVAGPDRYATAARLSAATFAPGVPVAYVAVGTDFPDALAAGAAGARLGGPVLLTPTATLTADTMNELTRLRPDRVAVVGSNAVVSEAVKSTLGRYAPAVVRIAGSDRYQTSRLVARDTSSFQAGGTVALATGQFFPDALSAGPVVAASKGSLVLVNGPTLNPSEAEDIVRAGPARLEAIGGTSMVPDGVLAEAKALFAPLPTTTAAPLPAPKAIAPTAPGRLGPSITPPGPGADITSDEGGVHADTTLPWMR
ncbi:N,N-dimethylformamidase beta subunit family domain-containing protein [Terrabacter koreensis]